MKRKLFLAAAFFIIAWAFTACESLSTCKICKQVTTEIGGGVISEGTETEYCDAALVAIEAKDDVIVGNTKISWECR
ncbi:MAG: hypothetical protein Q8868_06430 [Bacteroidota bacterium]|nr:hypothetical protein [Bacteroidota bacterium]